MLDAIRRWRDETDDTYLLGAVRVVIGLLLAASALRAARELSGGYFGDVFHWPILPERLVPSRPVYGAIVVVEGLLATLVVTGIKARPALLASALVGTYVLLCDRLQYHNNRWALLGYAFLFGFAPCDRSVSLARPGGPRTDALWAARLAELQVSMIYVASGGSKLLDPDWRGGKVILERLVLSAPEAIDRGVPAAVVEWFCEPGVAGFLSRLAIATELLLSVGLWLRPTRVLALWWGVWFHLTIEATSRVEGFTWLTLAIYVLFATPELRTRKVVYDPSSPRARAIARAIGSIDWLARFEVRAWRPDDVRRGHSVVVVRRDGTHATGVVALVMVARCTPLLFPLWVPLAVAASLGGRDIQTADG